MENQYSSPSNEVMPGSARSWQSIPSSEMDLDTFHYTAQPPTGQLSPASTNVEVPIDSSGAPTMAHSASSSGTDSWMSGNADHDNLDHDNHWRQGSDDILTVPKLEPVDDEFHIEDYQPPPSTVLSSEQTCPPTKQKRPRGRPRKNPLTAVASTSKVTKGRSKTGCITCRKRKKKCDEAKPRCMNCEKNAVVCEGYHEKQIWKSGKERAEEERMRTGILPAIRLQPLFRGVETAEDKIFWKHYVQTFSNVLTVEGEARNAFKDIILDLANRHQGLMHSILAVSSRHIDYDAPYGIKILAENPETSRAVLQERSNFHYDQAMARLHDEIAITFEQDDPDYHTEEYQTALTARYGQILCLLLHTRVEGNPRGEHRLHLQAYQTLIQHSPPQDTAFYGFITEFFQYHIHADDLIWHPDMRSKRLSSEPLESTGFVQAPRLLGVVDGLFVHLSRVTALRDKVRESIAAKNTPRVDYTILNAGCEIESDVRKWEPRWPPGDSRNRVSQLYKLAVSMYLLQTCFPPSPKTESTCGNTSRIPSAISTPQRRPSIAASIASTQSAPVHGSQHFIGLGISQSSPVPRTPSRNNSMHEGDGPIAIQTPPTPKPVDEDKRLYQYVEDSLGILEEFNPSDPAQTLLLIPCMLIGMACFTPDQQQRLQVAIRAVRGYTGLRNCDRVLEILQAVWAHMEEKDFLTAWDWHSIARRIGVDVICT